MTKPSADARRIFGPDYEPEQYIEMFHDLGAETVVFTMGEEGNLISENGRITAHVPARPVEVVDVTGAGDAFLAGFLTSTLDGSSAEHSVLFAREIVKRKLTTKGPLPSDIDPDEVYASLQESRAEEKKAGRRG